MQYDTYIASKLPRGMDTDFHRWKAEVLKQIYLPDYRLHKLWKLNFKPADVASPKLYQVYPTLDPKYQAARGKRRGIGIDPQQRGRCLLKRARQLNYAKALKREAERMIRFHRMEPADLEDARFELAQFESLVQKFSGKA